MGRRPAAWRRVGASRSSACGRNGRPALAKLDTTSTGQVGLLLSPPQDVGRATGISSTGQSAPILLTPRRAMSDVKGPTSGQSVDSTTDTSQDLTPMTSGAPAASGSTQDSPWTAPGSARLMSESVGWRRARGGLRLRGRDVSDGLRRLARLSSRDFGHSVSLSGPSMARIARG